MSRYIYIEKELADQTSYKSIKTAYESNNLTIIYFPRDNAYHYEKADVSDKTLDLVEKELARLWPGIREA